MDVQSSSPHSSYFSLEDALETVSQDLVYDPTTKQLCIRSQQLPLSKNNSQHFPHKKNGLIDTGSNKTPLKPAFSDCDSGYGGFSSESNTENGSQKSEAGPNENVDDLDLSIDSSSSTSRTVKSKLQFIQNVLSKITDNVTSSSSNSGGSGNSDCSSTENAATNQSDSIIETIIDEKALCLGKRPPYLPPKSDDEERRHQAEFNEMLKQAKKRELKESKLKRHILSKQIRQEEEISGAIRCWTNDILPAWPSSRATKRTRDLWWSGIPSPVRPRVWSMAIGNELKITDELFRICVERSRERIWTKQFVCRRSSNPYPSSTVPSDGLKHHRRVASQPIHTVHQVRRKSSRDVEALGKQLQSDCQVSNDKSAHCAKSCTSVEESDEEEEDEEDKNESIAYLIKLDVSRTFPQLGLFQENGPLHQSLSDILAAYAVFRPDTSYCQGMSFLAAMLLLNLDSPSDAFTAFANLLNSELLNSFYRLVPERIAAVYAFYDRQLQALLPRLASHFKALGLTTDLFFVDQIYTLFSRCLPLEVACRTWDLYLRDGDEFIFRASLSLLAMYESELLELECAEAAQWLAHLPEDMNTEKFFSTIATLKLVSPKLWHHSVENKDRAEKSSESANITLVKKLFPF